MKIEFTTGVAGARFAYEPGEQVDLPIDQARAFIKARQAVQVVEPLPLEAAAKTAPETASGRGGRRRTLKNLGGLLPS